MTGGAGFIGSNLVRALLDRRHEVIVLDDFSTGLESNLSGLDVSVIRGTVEDPQTLDSAIAGAAAVVHLAARGSVPRSIEDPVATHSVNATGTLNVLQAARSVNAHVLVSSSSSVYGANLVLPKREAMWMQPISPYGASKMAAESYALAFQAVYGLEVLVLRLFNVYGPGQRHDHAYAAVIPKFAWQALYREPVDVHGDGEQTRDFTHVTSVVRVIVDALDRRLSWPNPINLAFGEPVSVNTVVSALQLQLGYAIEVVHQSVRTGDVRNSMNDPALLKQVFPGISAVDFDEGLESVVSWLKAQTRG